MAFATAAAAETRIKPWVAATPPLALKDDIVVYKLTSGQPVIAQTDESKNPLGPVQALSSRFTGISF